MSDQLLPARADNTYQGHTAALYLLALVLFMKGGIGLGTIFHGHTAAVDGDGIPLATFGAGGAQAFLSLFAAWGLAQVTIVALGVIVLARYRSLVPLMFVVLLAEHLLRRMIFLVMPIPREGAPPGLYINLVIITVMLVGLVLSLRQRA